MAVWVAVILGLVQGICEFLPVSSSGHLLILNKAFNIQEGGTFMTIMLHLGTLIAVCIVYRRQIADIIRCPFQKKTGLLTVSTFVTAGVFLLFNKFFEGALSSGIYLGYSFIFTAILLAIVDKLPNKGKSLNEMKLHSSAAVGLMQGIGILPGVSRSGITISGALFFGLDRNAAAEYSFLLSIPAIIGGLATEIPGIVDNGLGSVEWLPVLVGTAVAAVSGYFAIRFMIKLITNKKLYGFSIYVAVLGLLVLLDQNIFHIVF